MSTTCLSWDLNCATSQQNVRAIATELAAIFYLCTVMGRIGQLVRMAALDDKPVNELLVMRLVLRSDIAIVTIMFICVGKYLWTC